MADQQVSPQVLAWGRGPDGHFFIQVAVQVSEAGKKVTHVPICGFTLTKDEEERLKASLTGLHIVTGNGRG